jgi:hypothetical protein
MQKAIGKAAGRDADIENSVASDDESRPPECALHFNSTTRDERRLRRLDNDAILLARRDFLTGFFDNLSLIAVDDKNAATRDQVLSAGARRSQTFFDEQDIDPHCELPIQAIAKDSRIGAGME